MVAVVDVGDLTLLDQAIEFVDVKAQDLRGPRDPVGQAAVVDLPVLCKEDES